MPLSIKDPVTEDLARRLARKTGESITEATRKALEDRLRLVDVDAQARAALIEDLAAIRRRWGKLPVLDARSAEAIIGYDQSGLPS